MSTWQNWQTAFLKQARSDWKVYQQATELEWPYCHRLHYLQMVTEKLSKALLIAGGLELENLTGSHAAFIKFIRAASKNRKLQKPLGLKKSPLQAHFKKLLPLAHEIESLAPTLAKRGPNPEYPWEDPAGNVFAPTDYSFPLINQLQKTPQGIQLLRHIEIFILRFEELFM